LFLVLLSILTLSSVLTAQSGRRPISIKVPVPIPEDTAPKSLPNRSADEPLEVTAEKNQEYRCAEDGSLARVIEPDDIGEQAFTAKELDSRVTITGKPKPAYTKEARRKGIQGFVTLKVLLTGRGKVGRVRVMKRLPAGLTENAIRAACRIEFKPAIKDGKSVAQWVTAEYVFRLADSSIFAP
jgi:TonB family protein